jgi:hypothetical protein
MTDVIIQAAAILFGALVFVLFCWVVVMSWLTNRAEEAEIDVCDCAASEPAPLVRVLDKHGRVME